MRTPVILMCMALAACSPERTDEPAAPEALQQPTVVGELKEYSGRSGGGDLVESLFDEALKGDPVLQQLYADIDARHRVHADSTEQWRHYEQKNQQYYMDAARHSERITDTLARNPLNARINASQARYTASMSAARQLDSTYDRTRAVVADLSELVKVQRTLAMLELYQQEHRPQDATLRAELERIQKLEARLREVVRE